MQAFKLVNAGFVDKVVSFDSLPERLLKGIKTREVAGFPRSWAKFLADIGSLRDVFSTTTEKRGPGDYVFSHEKIGREPCFYVLEYTDVNADKEFYRAISEFLRMNCDPDVRLKEKLIDMAIALAPNSTSSLDIEPEDIPVIVVKEKTSQEESKIVGQDETIIIPEAQKRRGRPKKVAVEA